MKGKDAVKSNFIGRMIQIAGSSDRNLNGKYAKVMDETKNSFVVLIDDKEKTILKNKIKFKIKIGEKNYIIDGKKIANNPYDRIKIKNHR